MISCSGIPVDVEYSSIYDKPCTKKFSDDTVIKIYRLGNYTSKLFELFFDEKISPWLMFLPERNEFANHIYGQTLVDLIVATQKEVKLNENITEVKFKDTINTKNLYRRFQEEVVKIMQYFKKLKINPIETKYEAGSPKLNGEIIEKDDIDIFVNIRNNIQHSGIVMLDGCSDIFLQVKCAVYLSVLERIGVAEEQKNLLYGWNKFIPKN